MKKLCIKMSANDDDRSVVCEHRQISSFSSELKMNLKKLLGLVAICIFAKFRPARCGVAPVRNAASCDAGTFG